MSGRRYQNGGGFGGMHQGPKVNGKLTYLFYPPEGVHFECELYDDLAIGSHGEIPPELHMICPSCGATLRVPGESGKGLSVEYFDKPATITANDGTPMRQVCAVYTDEDVLCGSPANNGKGVCGFRFSIKGGVIYKA